MPRPRPSPVSRPPKAGAPAEVAAAAGRDAPPLVPLVLFGIVALAYAGLYFGLDAGRREVVALLLVPDDLFRLWCGGEVANFSLLDRLPIAAGTLLVMAGAWLAGRLALAALGVLSVLDRLERVALATGVGLNLLSLYALAVGLAGGLRERWLFVGPLVLLAAGNLAMWMLGQPVSARREDNDRRWYWLLLAALPFALAMVLGAMLPPWEYDVREYHLQVPKEWFRAGRIGFLPHNIYGNMPLGSELTSLWGMALLRGEDAWWWGALVGKTTMACYSLVTAAALLAFGRRIHSVAAGVVAAVLFLSTPWIVVVGQTGHNEGPVALYVLLAFYALWWAGQGDPPLAPRFVLLAGFCAGSAVACKYPPALFLVVPLAAWIAARPWFCSRDPTTTLDAQAPKWQTAAGHTLLFLIATAAGCGLWLGKNWALAGNPTYPLLYDAFGGRTRTPEKDRQWTRVHAPQPDAQGRRFAPRQLADKLLEVAVTTPWASLALLPLAAFAWLARADRRLVIAGSLWLAFVFAAWWLLTHRLDRFLVLAVPIVALGGGLGAVALPHRQWRLATLTLVGLSLLVQFPRVTSFRAGDVRFFAPLQAVRLDELETGQGRVNPAHLYLNEHVQPGQRVLLLGDALPFDLEPPAIYNTCFDDCQFARLFRGRTRAERLAALQRENISHVFVHWGHLRRYRSPGNYGYTSDYPTTEVVRDELVRDQRLLRPITIEGLVPSQAELFEVVTQ